MKVVKLLDQASEDGPRGSLREQVGDHHDAGEVLEFVANRIVSVESGVNGPKAIGEG